MKTVKAFYDGMEYMANKVMDGENVDLYLFARIEGREQVSIVPPGHFRISKDRIIKEGVYLERKDKV